MGDEVIELSVEETNELRAKLGLAPLKVDNPPAAAAAAASNTNTSTGDGEEVLSLSVDQSNDLRAKLGLAPLREGSSPKIVHAPAQKDTDDSTQDRIAQAQLTRQVQKGMAEYTSTLADDTETSALSWAQQMRQQKKKSTKKKKTKTNNEAETYESSDLQGLHVAHAVSELQDGSTTVLTLADTSLLETDESNPAALENVQLAESRQQAEGLRKKRQLELGAGRAGAYAGFDDDEFEELGGTGVPGRGLRGTASGDAPKRSRGFQIGTDEPQQGVQGKEAGTLFTSNAISLESSRADVTASDFLSREEDEELNKKKKKKKPKFKKKDKKDKKKKKKKREESDDEEENAQVPTASLLDELEKTAVESAGPRKRRREEEDEEEEDAKPSIATQEDRRAKYNAIMERGNQRTKQAFQKKSYAPADEGEEPDDAFLNAALDKARRLNRLKSLQQTKRGASAVVEAVKSSETLAPTGIAFSVDETREFTRALRARSEQTQRAAVKKAKVEETDNSESKVVKVEDVEEGDEPMENLQELAREVKEDEVALDGTTGTALSIGRGVGNVLSFLQQTGEMKAKNAGKEEMRGRAKDKKTYEDYEALDLSKVVRINPRTATEKDKELAQREIKLEYRDKHGRLLTRKEAFRDLCYQFHGHGSGKRKEEKRLEQIAREQAEARLASRQGVGTFGALKETQKATGKAFVVHKTQS